MKFFVIFETVVLIITYIIIGYCMYTEAAEKYGWKEGWKTFNKPTANDVLLTFEELMKVAESHPRFLCGDIYGASEPNKISCFIVERDTDSLHHWHVLLDFKDYKKYVKWLEKREDEARAEALRASYDKVMKWCMYD